MSPQERLAQLDERAELLRRRINSGRGSQKLNNERHELLRSVLRQRAELLAEIEEGEQ
jgi:chaperonin cofactor prefoldin